MEEDTEMVVPDTVQQDVDIPYPESSEVSQEEVENEQLEELAPEVNVQGNDENLSSMVVNENDDNEGDGNEGENEEDHETKEENGKREKKTRDDHYSNKDEFSSDSFKIELGGLPKSYQIGHLKKFLNITLQLDAHRVRPGRMGKNVACIAFKDENARFKALTILNGYKWQGQTLTAEKADPTKDPMLLEKIDFLKVPTKEDEKLPLDERILKAVIPFHNLTYEEQLQQKEKTVRQFLRKFGNELSQMNPELKHFVHWHKTRRRGQICEVDEIVPSPITEGYRNKCEFTIGKNKESEKRVVGFRVASYKEGSVEVGSIADLRHLNAKMKTVVKLMEKFLETSEHEPYDPFSLKGVWRQLTVRTSNKDDVMITVVIHPQELEEEALQKIKNDVLKFFTEDDGVEAAVTSIFFQTHKEKQSGKNIEYEHIFGKTYIEETILGKTFKASPDAFLQVNTAACEVLYTKIAEIADIDQTSVVLDVCCGVGTIGLSIAESAYKVLGVETNKAAVEDARSNAEVNGLTNAVFYNGTAEDCIDNMIERAQRVSTIGIVDPPRAGLNGTVMNALRKCEYLNKLVYITCDPQAALPNFHALCRPRSNTYKGSYFVPIRAIPVDLFPDTPHFELIIMFERYEECKWDRIMDGNPRPKDKEYYDRVPELTYDPEQYAKEKEEKRKKKYEATPRRGGGSGRAAGGSWGSGRASGGGGWSSRGSGGGGRRRGYNDGGEGKSWGRRRSYERNSGNSWSKGYSGGGGGGRGRRNWGRGYEEEQEMDYDRRNRRRDRRPYENSGRQSRRPPPAGDGAQKFQINFGQGFQEGFQAALEALKSQGFGPGGGFNKAQNSGDMGQGAVGYNMNNPRQTGEGSARNWGFSGNSDNATTSASAYNNQVGYTNPIPNTNNVNAAAASGTGYSYRGLENQNVGTTSEWVSGRSDDNQAGSQWSQNEQSYEESDGKKWKGDEGYNSTQNYNYY